MFQTISQENRFIKLAKSPLPADVLLPISFGGVERISQPFEYRVNVISSNTHIDPKAVLHQTMTVEIAMPGRQTPHYFNGIINHFRGGPIDQGRRRYEVTLVPWFKLLDHTSGCRIFLGETILDIFKKVCKEHDFYDFRQAGVMGKHLAHDQNTQYRETTFQFLQRLLEEEGIFYFFRHEKDKHIMILADQPDIHEACVSPEIIYNSGSERGHQYAITEWDRNYSLYSGLHSNVDYNYENPSKGLQGEHQNKAKLPIAKHYETYDYPAQHQLPDMGDIAAKRRFHAQEFQHDLSTGVGNHPGFSAGCRFKLTKHPHQSEVGEYVLYQVKHSAVDGSYNSAMGRGGSEVSYHNEFICFPKNVPYSPPQLMRKPVIQGPQTATVVGDGEICTDKLGRIQVEFHWVRRQKDKHDKHSCWVRVAQAWAGKNRGSWFLPRVGDEVVVHFIDGDPDRPLVIGSVHNPDKTLPFPLPGNKTQSGIQTKSSPGGGGANILRFEDKKGKEEIYIHAEKDFNQKIKHDLTITVDNDYAHETKHDENHMIGNDMTHKTVNNVRVTVGKNTTQTIGENLTVNIGETGTIQAGKSLRFIVGGNTLLINSKGIFLNGVLVKLNLSS